MNLLRVFFIVTAITIFSNGVQAEDEHKAAVIATLGEVSNCKMVTTLETLPSYNKNVDWLQYALHELLVKAKEIGATHIIIEKTQPVGGFNGTVTATAYFCKS